MRKQRALLGCPAPAALGDLEPALRRDFDGRLVLDAWAGRAGEVAVGEDVALLDQSVDLTMLLTGRDA